MTVNNQYQPLPAEPSVLLAEAKQKIVKWYQAVELNDPAVLFPLNQLTDGYLYPHALPELNKEEALQLKHFLQLINRLKLLRLPANLNIEELISEKPDAKKLIEFFEELQSRYINALNEKAEVDITTLYKKYTVDPDADESKYELFIQKVVAYNALSTHGNVRDDYGCLRVYIQELKKAGEMPPMTQRQLQEVIKLRSTLQGKHKELNQEFKRVKRDINRYLCDVDHNVLIRHKEKTAKPSEHLRQERAESNQKEGLFKALYVLEESSNELKTHKQSLYHKKNQAEALSKVVSSNVGFGEGVVPAVVMFTVLLPFGLGVALPVALLCGLSGAVFNKFLVQADTFDVLKQLFLKDALNRMPSAAEDYQVILCDNNQHYDSLDHDTITASTMYVDFDTQYGWVRYKGKDHAGKIFHTNYVVDMSQLDLDLKEENREKFNCDPALKNALRSYFLRSASEKGFTASLATKQLKKDVAIALGVFSLTCGLVYGALSAMNLYAQLLIPLLLTAKVSLGIF